MKVQLPALPRGKGPFTHDDLRRFGLVAIEYDRALHQEHDEQLRKLALDVVIAFENAEHYTVPSTWIAKIEKLRDHIRGITS